MQSVRIPRRRARTRAMAAVAVVGAGALAGAVTMGGQAVAAETPSAVTVNLELQSHDSSILSIPDSGSASYYSGGWHSITSKNVNNPRIVQTTLAPGTYTFAVTYDGTRQQRQVTIGNDHSAQTVYFHTALVNLELQSHNSSILDIPGSGSASYYAGAWRSITSKNVNNPSIVQTEMLPGTYSFAATYNGTREQKTYTVLEPNVYSHQDSVQTVYFHTALVNVELQAAGLAGHKNGDILDIPGDGSASYYAGAWRSITSKNVNNPSIVQTEMLPGTYSFAVTYDGARNQKAYTVLEPNVYSHQNATQIVYFHYPFS